MVLYFYISYIGFFVTLRWGITIPTRATDALSIRPHPKDASFKGRFVPGTERPGTFGREQIDTESCIWYTTYL
jgi:hypothetical protein